jgi:hypothetical protein
MLYLIQMPAQVANGDGKCYALLSARFSTYKFNENCRIQLIQPEIWSRYQGLSSKKTPRKNGRFRDHPRLLRFRYVCLIAPMSRPCWRCSPNCSVLPNSSWQQIGFARCGEAPATNVYSGGVHNRPQQETYSVARGQSVEIGRRQGFESKTHASLHARKIEPFARRPFTKLQVSKRPKGTDLSQDLQGVTWGRARRV